MSTEDLQGASQNRRITFREAAAVATRVEINPIILHEVVMKSVASMAWRATNAP